MADAVLCRCSYCRHDLDFELEPFLVEEIRTGNCVVIAGAGVSTENSNSAPHTLYTELSVALGQNERDLSFPDLAEEYCNQPDGRFKLMQVIQSRFDYITKFRDLRSQSTKFYSELSTMPYFNTYLTTNWDKNFEEYCDAKPFVYDPDIRFWDTPERRVLKIHGTIDDYSSIVATRSDYADCLVRLRTSLVGGKLKDCLSNRTCIFVGYSLNDDDFRDIYAFVRNSLGKFSKQHFLVSPFPMESELPSGIKQIATDGTYFLKTIKQHMCGAECYLVDDIYDQVSEELGELQRDHNELWSKVNVKETPQMLGSAFYQDGLIHAYQIVIDQRKTGRFSDLHRLTAQIQRYGGKIADYRRRRRYDDVAYFRGYQNALIGVALSKEKGSVFPPPRFYYEAVGEMTRREFYKNLRKLPEIHKAAFRHFTGVSNKLEKGFVIQHAPWG